MTSQALSVGLAFGGGIVTVLSPCILPVLPIIVGRSLQSHRYGPIAIVGGLIGGFAITGSLLGIVASWIPDLPDALRAVAIVILLVMGVFSIFPELGYRFFHIFSIKTDSSNPIGLVGEFCLGSQLGLLWTPCAGPVLASILLLAAVQNQPIQAFGMLVVYGLGAAVPMLLFAYGGRYLGQRLLQLRSHSGTIQKIGGMMIIMTAIAMLLGLDVQIQLWLAPLFPSFAI
ncbi:cytochrome c biogenesis CcdA family protein [Chamaesiphon sp.]|uniref:cytochrome c biogenesis CcdA family protein n=1 Tax=Chamaesiphon sp. TaxID=2814140 RepID=UPI003593D1DA